MKLRLRAFILMALMLGAFGLAIVLRPTQRLADQGPKVDLATMIPSNFGDWHEDQQSSAQIIDPQQKELLDKIYSQTLSRSFVNGSGYRVMLSIAYGSDQRNSLQLHLPEVCYPSQGFTLHGKTVGRLALKNGSIPVVRIMTSLGQRNEPITYWTMIGNQPFIGQTDKKLIEMHYGLAGSIPDGMLIRISSIDPDSDRAYEVHSRFSIQMLEALAPEYRQKLTGILQ